MTRRDNRIKVTERIARISNHKEPDLEITQWVIDALKYSIEKNESLYKQFLQACEADAYAKPHWEVNRGGHYKKLLALLNPFKKQKAPNTEPCPSCKGTGKRNPEMKNGKKRTYPYTYSCPDCKGLGCKPSQTPKETKDNE